MLPELQSLLVSFSVPSIQFTKMLHSVYKTYGKSYGKYGVELSESKAGCVFEASSATFVSDVADHAKYNAFRTIRMTLSNPLVFRKTFEAMLMIFRWGLLHKNGNIRIEAVRLLEDLRLGIALETGGYARSRPTKKMREANAYYWPLFLSLHGDLYRLHQAYETENHERLDHEDLTHEGYVPYSVDTRDKMLKAIRMALEEYDFPFVEEKFEEFGYAVVDHNNPPATKDEEFPHPTREEVEKELQFFLILSWLPITVETVKDRIWNAPSDTKKVTAYFFGYYLSLLDQNGVEPTQEVIEILQNCWNTFPHKALWGKSPSEMI